MGLLRTFLALLLLSFSVVVLAEDTLEEVVPTRPSNIKLGFIAELRTFGVEERFHRARVAGAEITPEFAVELMQDVDAYVRGRVILETGSGQAAYFDEYSPRQLLRLRDAFVRWRPFDETGIVVGAISQDRWNSPLLFGKQSFPALLESIGFRAGVVTVRAEAQQAVPTSWTYSDILPETNDQLPTFFMERFTLGLSEQNAWKTEAHVSHFAFQNLGHRVAEQARFEGNSVVGQGPGLSSFLYDYYGFEAGALAEVSIAGMVKPILELNAVRNVGSVEGSGTAYSGQFGVDVKVADGIRLQPKAMYLHMESDAVPAIYLDRETGFTNRRGVRFKILAAFDKYHTELEATYGRYPVIRKNSSQDNFDFYQLQLRRSVDVL